MISRDWCVEQDRADPLLALREQFEIPPGVIYLDGNSLGALPKTVAGRVQETVRDEWGTGLVGSWNDAGWMHLPQAVGDKIATLIGAGPGEVVVADSTSISLFKLLHAALDVNASTDSGRTVVLSERTNFPTDIYIASDVVRSRDMTWRAVEAGEIIASLDGSVAVVVLTHVDYRSGRMHDIAAITRAAHDVGALVIWDLAHSAGVVPLELGAIEADAAFGCGYKFLNGGPGAPAFVWVNPRHVDRWHSPLPGWLGHEAPFEFADEYRPARGIVRFQCGTPPILSLVALDCGVDTVVAANVDSSTGDGGMASLRRKSLALTSLFIDLVDGLATTGDLSIVTPREPDERGSHVSLAHIHAYEIVQALVQRGVVGDFRAPDIARFGFAPLYTRFVDVWDASEHLRTVIESELWRDECGRVRRAIT